ncbi:MAG: DUF1887 family CARF protein [Sulfurimonadaceae bacterium]
MTLVSIVGDFHSSILPLFYHFSADINKHVIVYDDFRRDVVQAQKLIKGTQAFIEKHTLPITTHAIELNEDSYESIEKVIDTLLEIQSDPKELLINATDGLANIALLLSHKLLEKGIRFLIYDRFDNSYNILSKNSMLHVQIESSIPVLEHFMLKDVKVLTCQEPTFAEQAERELNDFFELYGGDKKEYAAKSAAPLKTILDTQTGFLYEFYIYNLLKRLNHDDIRMGVKTSDIYSATSSLHNEFDILIMKNNRLHMIECKFRDDLKKVDLIYKADSIRQTLDDESKVIILTNEDVYDFQNDIVHVTPRFEYQRANAKQIYFRGFPANDIARFIKEVDLIFGLNTPEIEKVIAQRDARSKDEREILKSFFG